MREAMGGGWLFQIVIFFVLLFAGYLALSINFSKAYSVKNEIIDIIERNHGVGYNFEEIQAYLDKVGYRNKGTCNRNGENDLSGTVWYGLSDVNIGGSTNLSNNLVPAQPGQKYYLCIKKMTNQYSTTHLEEVPYAAYFRLIVFFNMDIPVIGGLFDLTVIGDSHVLYYPNGLD